MGTWVGKSWVSTSWVATGALAVTSAHIASGLAVSAPVVGYEVDLPIQASGFSLAAPTVSLVDLDQPVTATHIATSFFAFVPAISTAGIAGIQTDQYHSADWVFLLEVDGFDPLNRNRLTQSVNLLDDDWATSNVTPTASGKVDPIGESGAFKLSAGSVSAFDRIYQEFSRPAAVDQGIVVRVALQAEAGSSPDDRIAFQLEEVGGGAEVYVPTSAVPVYGPGSVSFLKSGVKQFLVFDLRSTEWTEFELLWSAGENSFASDLRLAMYPGGISVNSGEVHIFLPHAEDEIQPDGLGFRSRGARSTGEINGPDGADGQALQLRVGTQSFTSTPTDTYPGGNTPAPNISFPEGLAQPAAIGKSSWIDDLINGQGIARTTISGFEAENVSRLRDHWESLSWSERTVRLYRGKPTWTLSQFAQVYQGVAGKPVPDQDVFGAPLRDPLHALTKSLNRPRFLGYGGAIRTSSSGSGDHALFDENPDLWIRGDLTVSLRFRTYQALSQVASLVSYGSELGTEATNYVYDCTISTTGGNFNALHMRWQYGSGTNESVSTSLSKLSDYDFKDGTWRRVTMVRDDAAKTVSFYLGSILIETVSYTNSPTGGWDGVPKLCAGSQSSWGGDIDDVRIFAKALSSDQVAAISESPIEATKFLDEELREYYPLDESIGVLTWGAVTTRLDERRMRECYIGGDGASGYARIPHHADLNPSSNDWTFEARVATAATANTRYAVFKGQMYRIWFNTTTSKWTVSVWLTGTTNNWLDLPQSGTYASGQDGFVLISGRWIQSSQELAIFVDGGSKATTSGAVGDSLNLTTNDLFLLAGGTAPGTNNMRGWISELRLIDEAVSDEDIQSRTNSILAGSESGLNLWFTFDETRADETAKSIWLSGTESPRYSAGKILDRQIYVSAKKDVTQTGAGTSGFNTTGSLENDLRFVGTEEGYQDLVGKRKPYAVGDVRHAPLILLDPFNQVYFCALTPLNRIASIYAGGLELRCREIDSGDDIWDHDFVTTADKVFTRFSTAWNDETADAADSVLHDGDIQILHSTPLSGALDDGLYVGLSDPMVQLDLWTYTVIGKLAVDGGSDIDLRWQFWNGEDWDDLRGLFDATQAFRIGGEKAWSNDDKTTSELKGVFTKTSADGRHWSGVSNVRWEVPVTWVKESLDDIATSMGVGSPSDSTDRYWLRCAAVANPGGYDQAPRLSAIWTNEIDVLTDTDSGLVRFNAPPAYKPSVDIEGDTSSGQWAQTLPEIVQTVIDRFYSQHGFEYEQSWGGGVPDCIVCVYAGLQEAGDGGRSEVTGADLLGPPLAGLRTLLMGDRDGKLALRTVEPPEVSTIDASVGPSDEEILSLSKLPLPDPPSTIRLAYRPYFAGLSESDVNPLLPFSIRKDVASGWRREEEVDGLIDNANRYLGSVPVEIFNYLVQNGPNNTIAGELAKWVNLLGTHRSGWKIEIPQGLIEHDLGVVIGLRTTRYGIWHGVDPDGDQEGPAFIVLEVEDDLNDEITSLSVWGSNDA